MKTAAALALGYLAAMTLAGIAAVALSGCGGTLVLRTEQVPTPDRVQWEIDVSDRINKLDERVKKLEKGETDA